MMIVKFIVIYVIMMALGGASSVIEKPIEKWISVLFLAVGGFVLCIYLNRPDVWAGWLCYMVGYAIVELMCCTLRNDEIKTEELKSKLTDEYLYLTTDSNGKTKVQTLTLIKGGK